MTVETRTPDSHQNQARPHTSTEVDAGVLEDARRRQHRHRRVAGILTTAAGLLAGGLILGFTGGAGNGHGGNGARGQGSSPAAGSHVSYDEPAGDLKGTPQQAGQFGLLAPGVAWAVNGIGFYVTRDGGRRWYTVDVPNLNGDVIAHLYDATSPAANALVLSFTNGASDFGTCADSGPPGSATRPVGEVAVSSDAGRTWRGYPVPGCRLATNLSFLSATTGFAITESGKQDGPLTLMKTTDGARHWQPIGRVPTSGPIDFTNQRDGWLLGQNGAARLYRTTDGGRTWQRASICGRRPNVHVQCGEVSFSGSHGVVTGVTYDSSPQPVGTLVYTTDDNGRSWSIHKLGPFWELRHYGMPALFRPTPRDVVVSYSGGLISRSTDGGRSWTRIPQPKFPGHAQIYVDFLNADYGWAYTGSRFDYTTDAGRHWRAIHAH